MNNKLAIAFALLIFLSIGAHSQTGDGKTGSVKPAKDAMSQNSGERDLPKQLKENQLKGQPSMLKADSSVNTSKAVKRTKNNCTKPKKKRSSSTK
jgi:hypothetical protein